MLHAVDLAAALLDDRFAHPAGEMSDCVCPLLSLRGSPRGREDSSRAVGGESFGQPSGEAHHGWGTVRWIEQDVDDIRLAGVGQCFGQGFDEFSVGGDA